MNERSTLDEYFSPRGSETPLGIVVDGSLSTGLRVRIDPRYSIEKLAVGRYVVIRGRQTGRKFFGIITDIALDASNPDLIRRPPPSSDDLIAEVYNGSIVRPVLPGRLYRYIPPGSASGQPDPLHLHQQGQPPEAAGAVRSRHL